MAPRAFFLFTALFVAVNAQANSIDVDVSPSNEIEDVEKRYTPELVLELESAKEDALLLYTEYSARSGADLKSFIKSLSRFSNDTIAELDRSLLDFGPKSCSDLLHQRLKKIEYDAHRAAGFSAENHHKFFLGHMIVFRMHLNKSEDYIKKCEHAVRICGTPCETTTKVKRWRRQAQDEISRVRDDLQHSRKSYKDLLTHARRKLNHIRRQANSRAKEVLQSYRICADRG